MFGIRRKKKEAVLNATNAYIGEMVRAILQEEFGTEIYITQIRFKTEGPTEPSPDSVWKKFRPDSNSILQVEVSAFFTSLNTPLPKGREGVPPVLPRFNAIIDLTNEMSGWFKWDILFAHIRVMDYNEPLHPLIFKVFSEKDTADKRTASPSIKKLSQELFGRGPNVLHQNM